MVRLRPWAIRFPAAQRLHHSTQKATESTPSLRCIESESVMSDRPCRMRRQLGPGLPQVREGVTPPWQDESKEVPFFGHGGQPRRATVLAYGVLSRSE